GTCTARRSRPRPSGAVPGPGIRSPDDEDRDLSPARKRERDRRGRTDARRAGERLVPGPRRGSGAPSSSAHARAAVRVFDGAVRARATALRTAGRAAAFRREPDPALSGCPRMAREPERSVRSVRQLYALAAAVLPRGSRCAPGALSVLYPYA